MNKYFICYVHQLCTTSYYNVVIKAKTKSKAIHKTRKEYGMGSVILSITELEDKNEG